MAPEVMISENYEVKADVYSFGMFLFEVMTGLMPFEKYRNSKEIVRAVIIRKEKPILIGKRIQMKSVMEKC
jgi:serine/threonine protein kinase